MGAGTAVKYDRRWTAADPALEEVNSSDLAGAGLSRGQRSPAHPEQREGPCPLLPSACGEPPDGRVGSRLRSGRGK